jgi:hypothetical protein
MDYDEETGKIVEFNGRPQKRPPKKLPLCRDKTKGCPKGSPEKPLVLTPRNREAFRHWRECRAVGKFPDDPLVYLHADILQSVADQVAEHNRILSNL